MQCEIKLTNQIFRKKRFFRIIMLFHPESMEMLFYKLILLNIV